MVAFFAMGKIIIIFISCIAENQDGLLFVNKSMVFQRILDFEAGLDFYLGPFFCPLKNPGNTGA